MGNIEIEFNLVSTINIVFFTHNSSTGCKAKDRARGGRSGFLLLRAAAAPLRPPNSIKPSKYRSIPTFLITLFNFQAFPHRMV